MTTTANIIETRGLAKRFGGRPAVIDLDLEVPRGSAFGFLGHNGAGKTTLIRMLLGLTQPDAGEMQISGRPLPRDRAAVLARVGAMVEEPSFHRHLTGRENLRVNAAARGPAAAGRIDGALRRVGLSDRADDRVKTYSQYLLVDDPILDLVLAKPEGFRNAEERRLLYVALTRARKRVFVMTTTGSPSSFTTELLDGTYQVVAFGAGVRKLGRRGAGIHLLRWPACLVRHGGMVCCVSGDGRNAHADWNR